MGDTSGGDYTGGINTPASGTSSSGNWWDNLFGGSNGSSGSGVLSSIGKSLGIGQGTSSTGSSLLNNAGPLLLAGGAGLLLSQLLGGKSSGGGQTVNPVAFPSSNLSPTQLVNPGPNPGSVMGTPVAPANTGLGSLITPQQITLPQGPVAPTSTGKTS